MFLAEPAGTLQDALVQFHVFRIDRLEIDSRQQTVTVLAIIRLAQNHRAVAVAQQFPAGQGKALVFTG